MFFYSYYKPVINIQNPIYDEINIQRQIDGGRMFGG